MTEGSSTCKWLIYNKEIPNLDSEMDRYTPLHHLHNLISTCILIKIFLTNSESCVKNKGCGYLHMHISKFKMRTMLIIALRRLFSSVEFFTYQL